jgi:diguanylate cyclase (GGDEF)-like protein/PAS domain S-box-containing protein
MTRVGMTSENQPQSWRSAVIGTLFALAGVAVVELLLRAGHTPLGPVGWPAMGAIFAAALYGLRGLLGAIVVVVAYYLVHASQPERFPAFFASAGLSIAWLCGTGLLCGLVLALRARLTVALRAEVREMAAKQSEERLRGLTQAAQESEARLRLLADSLPALVGYVDREERFRFANRAYETWFGIREVMGRTVREVWGDERYEVIRPNMARALKGERVTFEYRFAGTTGQERQVQAEYVPDVDTQGAVRGFFVLGTDVTTLVRARVEVQEAHRRLERALEGSSAALWDTDLASGRVYLSEPWAEMLGRAAGETVTTIKALSQETHPEDALAIRKASRDALKGLSLRYEVEHRVRAANGEWRWILSRGQVTERDPKTGRALRMIGTNLDITDRRQAEEKLKSATQTDPLTGLANRTLLMDRIRLAKARSVRTGSLSALLYVDVDRFKEVNDGHGHAAGDTVLRELGGRLRACVRQTDTVARIGGDELVVLLEDLKDAADAQRIAEKVLLESHRPVHLGERSLDVRISVGLALARGDADEAAWLARADAALYRAKQAGRNRIAVAP